MRQGDHVQTPGGDGAIVSFRTEKRWIAQRPYTTAWITVRLADGSRREFAAAEVQPIREETSDGDG